MITILKDTLKNNGLDSPLADAPAHAKGDYGIPLFSLAREQRKNPKAVYDSLVSTMTCPDIVAATHFEGGYLNFELNWDLVAQKFLRETDYSALPVFNQNKKTEKILLEYSSPNTNKAQHIGHVRNNVLGSFLARILSLDASKEVSTACLVNDRGIHVCKSMLMYLKDPHAFDDIPKGDHKVGAYYAAYNAAENDQLQQEARDLLIRWEQGDPEIHKVWSELRGEVLDGFQKTYERLGVHFDQIDYESDLYHIGKAKVLEALSSGIVTRNEKGQVVFPLDKVGMEGDKVLLREDGTTFYLTQDIGVASSRSQNGWDSYYYVVGDEQNYHFQTLGKILPHVLPGFQATVHHVAYGMVELPEGRMQSRTGNVILADDLMDALKDDAKQKINASLADSEKDHRAEVISQAALKFYMLDAVATSKIRFDMEKALDPTGRSGAYILYTYARLKGVMAKVTINPEATMQLPLTDLVKDLIKMHFTWSAALQGSLNHLDSSILTNHLYNTSRLCNTLYNDSDHIVKNMSESEQKGMVHLFDLTSQMIRKSCDLLGFNLLEKM